MGFLIESQPLEWSDAINKLKYVRDHGIEQFVHIFHQVKYVSGDLLRWGDEIEHSLFKLVGDKDSPNRTVKVSLRSPEVIKALQMLDDHGSAHGLSEADLCSWMPEYGRWMLESTPRKPYEGLVDLLKVEDCMRLRRSRLLSALQPDEIAPTVSCSPLFGVGDFCVPSCSPAAGSATGSLFVPDEVMFPHARFPTLTKNIRARRGRKVEIRRPRFKDDDTPEAQHVEGEFVPETVEAADSMDHVYADCMAFGMGCCCLQVTFQASNITESTHLFDHLAVLTPMMLALTAATPFLRGWLIDEDSRWTSVAQSVDDRTPAEMGVTGEYEGDQRLAGNGRTFQRKSRYDSIDCYICNGNGGKSDPTQHYNDLSLVYSDEHVQRLMHSGIDETLAKHIAHLFARDPLVIFKDRICLDDRVEIDHWENLQSTNWQTMRWKPPPPHKGTAATSSEDHIGWRVEFRSMEIQITDFENAAFTTFIMLLSRVILALELTLYIPISKVDENMQTAQMREAATTQQFWFRGQILPRDIAKDGASASAAGSVKSGFTPKSPTRLGARSVGLGKDSCRQMTLAEIFGGSDEFYGLIPLCEVYLDFIGCDSVVRSGLKKYMDFVLKRATGEVQTPATWMRHFITSHPSYKKDSRVPAEAAYDLMKACSEIGQGKLKCPELHGDVEIKKVEPAVNPFGGGPSSSSSSSTIGGEQREQLLEKFRQRAAAKKVGELERDIERAEVDFQAQQRELDSLRKYKEEAEDFCKTFPQQMYSPPGSPRRSVRSPSPGSSSPTRSAS